MFVVIVAIVCYNGYVCTATTYQANKRQAGKPGMPGNHLKKAYDGLSYFDGQKRRVDLKTNYNAM